jgi:hypothetical protein
MTLAMTHEKSYLRPVSDSAAQHSLMAAKFAHVPLA